nr:methionine--tRNA ligase subunit beta [Acidobacteriota bacterium]
AKWWPADLHVIGKDITRFHCVIWPAMLMSAKEALPGQVFGHGWISVGNQRMSKSLGNIVDPIDAAERCGVDPLRLYLVKEVPYGGDGDFAWDRLDEKYNADLANNLGNLVSRLSAMTERYRGGHLPASSSGERLEGVATKAFHDYRSAMDRLAIHEGAAAAFRVIDAANGYIADTQPWALAKNLDQSDRLTAVLADAAEAVRVAAVLLLPIMPTSAAEILRRMGEPRPADAVRLSDAAWRKSGDKRILNEGPLWPRKEVGAKVTELPHAHTPAVQSGTTSPAPDSPSAPLTQAAAPLAQGAVPAPASTAAGEPHVPGLTQAVAPTPPDDRISIEDFMKVELRAAKIVAAERVPKSKKLMKMTVDVGTEQRTIVAGIAEAYEPDALVGKTVVIVANLKPAKLMGIESNGMVLAASPDGGMPIVLNAEPATPGTRVR